MWRNSYESRRSFIGGSDARIIMGSDEAALVRLWQEKRGEVEPEDLSGNLIVQLGAATEDLNRSWYERNTGRRVGHVQRWVKHSALPWMAATLDGIVEGTEAVFEAKFMLPWSFSEEAAAEKYMAQVQQNMWVTHLRSAVLSIITGGGKWVEIAIPMDPLYLSVLVSAEKKFWRCVQTGEVPHLINAEPPRARVEAIRIVDMTMSNSWAEFAALYRKPGTPSSTTNGQGRTQSLDAGRRQGSHWAWPARKALEIRGCELRCAHAATRCYGDRPCPGPVNRLRHSPQRLPRRKPTREPRKIAYRYDPDWAGR
jgi:putative phage-type endonuclease